MKSFFTYSIACLVALLTEGVYGQPFSNTLNGRPGASDINRTGENATVIYANSDGANQANEFIYFKVYSPGGGSNWSNYDWYTNPTAWLTGSDFHFNNINLRMYSNSIKFNNSPSSRRIVFDQDTWSTDDNQFTGLGSSSNKDLRYQIKDATKSHTFFAGQSAVADKKLLTINGDGRIMIPKNGSLEFGADLPLTDPRISSNSDTYKQVDAGRIGYQVFSNGLDIVGAGKVGLTRRIKFWAEGGSSFTGSVSIGTDQTPNSLPGDLDLSAYKLFVNGGILSKECRVETDWADYVFRPGYNLLPLNKLEQHIQQTGHLPNMPSEEQIRKQGLNLGEISKLQQEKIEELTLHLIALKKELDALKTHLHIQVQSVK